MPIITLLTDFGTRDSYVAEMRGVLLAGRPAPSSPTSATRSRSVTCAPARTCSAEPGTTFPPGTVHLAVVDPGVGGARAALAVCGARTLLRRARQRALHPGARACRARSSCFPCRRPRRRRFTAAISSRRPPRRSPAGSPVRALGAATADAPRAPAHHRAAAGRQPSGRRGDLRRSLRHARHQSRAGRAAAPWRSRACAMPLRRTFSDVAPGELVAFVGRAGRSRSRCGMARPQSCSGARGDPGTRGVSADGATAFIRGW